MKKNFLMLAALAAFSGLAGATSFTTALETCSSAGGVNQATSFTATQLVCGQFNGLPGGDTLTAVNLFISDSFNQGVPGGDNEFDFTYTLVDPDDTGSGGTPPNTCVTSSGSGSLGGCLDIVSGSSTDGVSGSAFYQIGNVITTFTETYLGSGTFVVGTVSGSPDPTALGSALNATGSIGSTAFVTFTYSTPVIITGVPEPASMMLLGGGLLAAGLIGRKKFTSK
jgi:PEP-CTERM motif